MNLTRRLLLINLGLLLAAALLGYALWREPQRLASDSVAWRARAAERGAVLYEDACTECHGVHGEGLVGPALNAPDLLHGEDPGRLPPRLQARGWRGDLPSFLMATIANGRPGSKMPGWAQTAGGPLTPSQIDDLVAFLLTWRDAEPTPSPFARPQSLHQRSAGLGYYLFHGPLGCADCHAFDNAAGVVGPELTGVVARLGRDAVRNAIINPNDHLAPGYAPRIMPETFAYALSENQIRSLLDYLEHPENAALQVAPLERSEKDQALWGKMVADGAGCFGCHTVDGTASDGPTFLGLYGQTRTLDDGVVVVADDDYLYESIVSPSAKQVAGYPDIMDQDYGFRLSEDDIRAVIAYIKTLR